MFYRQRKLEFVVIQQVFLSSVFIYTSTRQTFPRQDSKIHKSGEEFFPAAILRCMLNVSMYVLNNGHAPLKVVWHTYMVVSCQS